MRRDVEDELRDAFDARRHGVFGPVEVDRGERVGELERRRGVGRCAWEVQVPREGDVQARILQRGR